MALCHLAHVGESLYSRVHEDEEVAYLGIALVASSFAVEVQGHVLCVCNGVLQRLAHLSACHIDNEPGRILGTAVIELKGVA